MFYEPTVPSPAKRDLFGREYIESSGIGKQQPLFHEPVAVKLESPKSIGSTEASRPENTAALFRELPCGLHSRADLEVMSWADLVRAAEALKLEHADCVGSIGRTNLIQRILEAQGLED